MHALSIKKEGIYRAYFAQELFLSNTFFQNSSWDEALFLCSHKELERDEAEKIAFHRSLPHFPLC